MPNTPATIGQADLNRALRGFIKLGIKPEVRFNPDGSIVVAEAKEGQTVPPLIAEKEKVRM